MSLFIYNSTHPPASCCLLDLQAREKEERLLRRQFNREKLEEKRKQKAAEKTKTVKTGYQGTDNVTLNELLFTYLIAFLQKSRYLVICKHFVLFVIK